MGTGASSCFRRLRRIPQLPARENAAQLAVTQHASITESMAPAVRDFIGCGLAEAAGAGKQFQRSERWRYPLRVWRRAS